MGSLVRTITGPSQAGYGTNILEVPAPRQVSGTAANVVGIVADLPWGPVNTPTTITQMGEYWAAFYPNAFASTKDFTSYPAILAMLNKRIPAGGAKVCRIAATSQAKASSGAITAGTGTVTIDAKYPGVLGNSITYTWAAATGGDAAERNLTIAIGTGYSKTYEDLATGDLASISDPYVDISVSSPTAMPATGSATALTSGSDGTAVAADFVGSSSSSVGIRQFYGEGVQCDVLFAAQVPEALKAGVNAGLKAWCDDTDKGIAVLCTVDDQATADAITDVASYRSDRVQYPWPMVKTTNFFAADAGVIEVDGNAFAAFAWANVEQWESAGGSPGAPYLSGIVGLEDESASRSTLDAMNAAGIAPWMMAAELGGAIIRKGVATELTSTGAKKLRDRRLQDRIQNALARFAAQYTETQLEIDLTNEELGPNMRSLVGAMAAWLKGEVGAGDRGVRDFGIDPYSANTAADLAANRATIIVQVALWGTLDELTLQQQVGTTVSL